ncbi:MAG: terephthalate 1,2-dioxygenase [Rhizobiales bacterium 62-17]|mgnify:FL=1|nr:terephthalate 1,2-dioxygenase [Hyphomicrobiales bacterium]OJY00894.1 MAG: terephthalate 1,2-dioxygenase [Rhizobiales bacterium 62-17]
MSNIDNDYFFAIARAQSDYARCIDDDRLEDWPAFFEEACLYRITSAASHRDGYEASVVFANSRGMLTDRISALREANIYERQAYRHLLGMPALLGQTSAGLRTETPFMVARIMQDGTTDLYATGRYLDIWNLKGEAPKIVERIVVCDSSRFDTLLAIPL